MTRQDCINQVNACRKIVAKNKFSKIGREGVGQLEGADSMTSKSPQILTAPFDLEAATIGAAHSLQLIRSSTSLSTSLSNSSLPASRSRIGHEMSV